MSEKNELNQMPRNPMHEAGAGEIASIIHNEAKGGEVLGKQRELNAIDQEDREKSSSGIITGKQKTYPELVLQAFTEWVNKEEPTDYAPMFDYLVDVFCLILPKTARIDGMGVTHYRKEVFPIMKLIRNPIKESNFLLQEGQLLKGPNELTMFGVNPDWTEWDEKRKSNMDTNTKVLELEPPYYYGTINMWNTTYGAPENVLHVNNVHNTRFAVPLSEIKGILSKEAVINNFTNMINEFKENQDS